MALVHEKQSDGTTKTYTEEEWRSVQKARAVAWAKVSVPASLIGLAVGLYVTYRNWDGDGSAVAKGVASIIGLIAGLLSYIVALFVVSNWIAVGASVIVFLIVKYYLKYQKGIEI